MSGLDQALDDAAMALVPLPASYRHREAVRAALARLVTADRAATTPGHVAAGPTLLMQAALDAYRLSVPPTEAVMLGAMHLCGPDGVAMYRRLAGEVLHLRAQRDSLQTSNTELVLARRRQNVGVAVVLRHHGCILLGKRKGGHGAGLYACPGGWLERDELVVDGALRELEEETGFQRSYGATVNVTPHYTHDVSSNCMAVFATVDIPARVTWTPKLMEPDKCEGWAWYDVERMPPVDKLFSGLGKLIGRGVDPFIM